MSEPITINGEVIERGEIVDATWECPPVADSPPEFARWDLFDGPMIRMKPGPMIYATVTLKDGRTLFDEWPNPNYR